MSLCNTLYLCIMKTASSKFPMMKEVLSSLSLLPFSMTSYNCPSLPNSRKV